MNERTLPAPSTQDGRVPSVLTPGSQLGFAVRVLGMSHAPVLPQQVGDWWLEPVTDDTPLPPRAVARLRAVRAAGITPRAVVVFHELPRAAGGHPAYPSVILPRAARRVVTLAASRLLATVRARTARRRVARTRPRRDPCLVVVTADGAWVEIDRWYR